jgi:hypothetical protein
MKEAEEARENFSPEDNGILGNVKNFSHKAPLLVKVCR